MIQSIHPQLCTLVDNPPEGADWLYEMKFDGYRLICIIQNNEVKLFTRNQKNWTEYFPQLVQALKKLKLPDVILDGEIVVVDEKNLSNFQLLQNAIHEGIGSTVYYVFDLLYLEKKNLMNLSLIERKKLLKKILPKNNKNVVYSDHLTGSGKEIYKKACELGWEGIIAKSKKSIYQQKRSRDWLKIKCVKRQEFVVGGYTLPQGARSYFGALLLGVYNRAGHLQYCGRVGTGFTEDSLKMVFDLLKKNKSTTNPFITRPPGIRKIVWVQPKIVVEVEFFEWTQDGSLRHPSFKGLRSDKSAKQIKKETAKHIRKKS